MEPRIQYAKSSDGVNIAYATAGDGPPLLMVPAFPLSDVQARWKASAHLYQPLAERLALVWYDFRGTGLSEREVTDYSLEAMVRDIEAVVEATGLARFAMLGAYAGVPIAATYAATHSEKVSSLFLVDGSMKYSDHAETPIFAAERALRHGDWTVYTETLARVLFGFENQELSARAAVYMRECVGK